MRISARRTTALASSFEFNGSALTSAYSRFLSELPCARVG